MRKYSFLFMMLFAMLPETYVITDTVAVISATTIAESRAERDEKKAVTPGAAREIKTAMPHTTISTIASRTSRPFIIGNTWEVIFFPSST